MFTSVNCEYTLYQFEARVYGSQFNHKSCNGNMEVNTKSSQTNQEGAN